MPFAAVVVAIAFVNLWTYRKLTCRATLQLLRQLSIPPDVFDKIRSEWQAALPSLDCTSDQTFCHVADSCENVASKVKPAPPLELLAIITPQLDAAYPSASDALNMELSRILSRLEPQ